ncbi:hypothetical protein COCON_G00199090 [Conger conger]|uniref:Uncharacterized protein n=1 Tax=Conger conger TaxID=82655 RepID=A0A9Q1D1Y2_CONCO|nr:hypothetical protein COCON_G00199090 [Conger conger]
MQKSLLDADIDDMGPEESKRLIDQLRNEISDIKVQLQITHEERERIDKDMEFCLKGDALAAKLGAALRSWDTERKRKLALSRQLEEQEVTLSSSGGSGEDVVKERSRKKASLVREEKRLSRLVGETRRTLAETESRCLAAGEELQRQQARVAMAASGQSQKSKEEQLVDAYVAKLDVPATVRPAGPVGPKRRGRPRK